MFYDYFIIGGILSGFCLVPMYIIFLSSSGLLNMKNKSLQLYKIVFEENTNYLL